jgi:Holliday junction resolvase-like predicted endonuclease
MEKGTANERENAQTIHSKIYEQVKRNNLMDWGEIELAESVLQNEIRND